jgi:catechol 2,3-dioxygenase-like lactoylglutathione lyase family enzyme
MIKQLAHICILTNDLDKTRSFYLNTLGLDIGFEFEKDGEQIGYYITVGNNTFIEVFQGEPGGSNGILHVAIEVSDLDNLIRRIREHGYEITDKKQGADMSWQAWVTDPNGVRIEFHEYTADSRQLSGGICRME